MLSLLTENPKKHENTPTFLKIPPKIDQNRHPQILNIRKLSEVHYIRVFLGVLYQIFLLRHMTHTTCFSLNFFSSLYERLPNLRKNIKSKPVFRFQNRKKVKNVPEMTNLVTEFRLGAPDLPQKNDPPKLTLAIPTLKPSF
jgi:hypothetical protein